MEDVKQLMKIPQATTEEQQRDIQNEGSQNQIQTSKEDKNEIMGEQAQQDVSILLNQTQEAETEENKASICKPSFDQMDGVQIDKDEGQAAGISTPPFDSSVVEENHLSFIDNFRNKPTMCVYHKEKEVVSFFCSTCEMLLCSLCIIQKTHSSHDLCEADDTKQRKKSELIKLVENRNKEIVKNLNNKVTEIQIKKGRVLESCNEVSSKVNEHTATLRHELEKWSRRLLASVEDHQGRQIQELDEQLLQLKTCISFIELFQTEPSVAETLNGTKLIQMLQFFHDSSEPSKHTNSEVTNGEIQMAFVPGNDFNEKDIHTFFGNVIKVDSKSSEFQDSDNMEVIKPQVTEGADNSLPDNEDFYDDAIGSCSRYTCGNKSIDRISPVDATNAFLVTEQKLYLVDLSKAHEKRYMEDLAPLMTDVVHITPVTARGIYVQQLGCTLVQRVTKTGQVYRYLDVQDTLGRTFLQCIGTTLSGMVIIGTFRKTYADSWYYQNIEIHNKNGITSISIVKDELFDPDVYDYGHGSMRDVVKTKSGLFSLNTSLSLPENPNRNDGFIRNFRKVTTYHGVIGCNPKAQFNPRGICQDEHDRLIVSDYWNHAIHQLTSDGQFIKFLMKEEDGLTYPTSVALDKYKYLWIGQKDGTIHIRKYRP